MSQYTVQSILFYYSHLFILNKILGICPYNLQIFQQFRELKKSAIGTIYVIFVMIAVIILFNLMIFSFTEEDNTLKNSQSTLTFVISTFLTYIGLVMMATDQLTAISNQNGLGQLYERIRMVDERLLREGCWVDNTNLRKRITTMIALVFISEVTVTLSSYLLLIEHIEWKLILWIFACFPTLCNSLDKIWFAATLTALQQRFLAINKALHSLVKEHEQYKMNLLNCRNGVKKKGNLMQFSTGDQKGNFNFLHGKMNGANIGTYNKLGKNRIIPVATVATYLTHFNRVSTNNNHQATKIIESRLNNVIEVEEKLNNFCQLHDELCEIAKMLNELWSYPILVLMAYGFLIFTAELYFLYCATQGQYIPSLFLSAKNAFITSIFLTYTAGKCIYLIYLSWSTSLESKCTGILLHKCGVVADNNDLYEIVILNHLSLKLLNHGVDFTACGFFSLNMETLYGISGGITSYLIILIQFNLAAQQAREATNRTSDSGIQVNR